MARRSSGVSRRSVLLALAGGGGGLALLYGDLGGEAPFMGGGGGYDGPTPSDELLIETGEEYVIGSDESESHLGLRNEPDAELTIEAGGELVLEAI